MKKHKFFKESNQWFADLPQYLNQGFTSDHLEMVGGSFDGLSFLALGADVVELHVFGSSL